MIISVMIMIMMIFAAGNIGLKPIKTKNDDHDENNDDNDHCL